MSLSCKCDFHLREEKIYEYATVGAETPAVFHTHDEYARR